MPVTNSGRFGGARMLAFFPPASPLEVPELRTRQKHRLPEVIVLLEGNR